MKIALGIEYNGSQYFGWQRQKEVKSVQECLENALSIVANHKVEVQCAGRTDAGVHGTGQIVHFETTASRKAVAWTMGANANLPKDIAVRWAKEVPDEFHARFSATARRYRYLIFNDALRPGILSSGVSHYHGDLDVTQMHKAGQYLLGENDFTSFRATHCQSKSPWRNLMHLNVTSHGKYIVVDIKANAFVHHMVRNIAGVLIAVGSGRQPVGWVKEVLAAKDRRLGAETAPPYGLYLVEVAYPQKYGVYKGANGPLFLLES